MSIKLNRFAPTPEDGKIHDLTYTLFPTCIRIGDAPSTAVYNYSFRTGEWLSNRKFLVCLMVDSLLPGFGKEEFYFEGKTFWDDLKLYFRYLISK